MVVELIVELDVVVQDMLTVLEFASSIGMGWYHAIQMLEDK